MNKEELWQIIVKQNPSLDTQDKTKRITFTPAMLRKLFDLVWDKASVKSENKAFEDIFSSLMKGGKK